ncbi:MAG: B12-binding domain-containing protein [Clostridia bacterium]
MKMTKETLIEDFHQALLEIDRIKAAEVFDKCFSKSQSFEEIEKLTIQSLERIGSGWEEGQLSLSQVYMSGVICERLIEKYLPEYSVADKSELKIAIGVLLDHHALGKRIVYSILRASGYHLEDFGQGLSVKEIVDKTIKEDIDMLLISTLMLNSALKVKQVVQMLREKGSEAKVIVGGAPFRLDSNLWQQVNADADGKSGVEVQKIINVFSERGRQS